MDQKGLTPMLIVLLIVLIFGGYFLWNNYSNNRNNQIKPFPTPLATSQIPRSTPSLSDETANWKTFVDKSNTFSVKYPSDFTVKEVNAEREFRESRSAFISLKHDQPPSITSGTLLVTQDFDAWSNKKFLTGKGYAIYVWVFNNSQNFNVDSWYKKYEHYPNSISALPTPLIGETKQIDENSFKIGFPLGQLPSIALFKAIKGKMIYIIIQSQNNKDTLKEAINNGSILDKVLATFKFTQ